MKPPVDDCALRAYRYRAAAQSAVGFGNPMYGPQAPYAVAPFNQGDADVELLDLEHAEFSAAEKIAAIMARSKSGQLHDQAQELARDFHAVAAVVNELTLARQGLPKISPASLTLADTYYRLANGLNALHDTLSKPPRVREHRPSAALLKDPVKAAGNACYDYAWCVWNLHDATQSAAVGKTFTAQTLDQLFN